MVNRWRPRVNKRRTITVAIVAALALVAAVRHPTADIEILTHDPCDRAPHRMQAGFDLGIVAVKLLVTWTGKHLSGR
jgi:hypothetical protein